MYRHYLLLTLVILFLNTTIIYPHTTSREKKNISGRVIDRNNMSPIYGCTVSLWQTSDGTFISSTTTDEAGYYVFENLKDVTYTLQASFTGYKSQSAEVRPSSLPQEEISLIGDYTTLSDVVVTPPVTSIRTQLGSRLAIVGADLTTSANAAKDLIDNLPGCTVDIKGDVMLRGSRNVRFMVDGRPTNLNSKELLNVLPSSSISRVELITTPSSKEYPDGPQGIVNIITSRSTQKGLGGAVDLSYGTGEKYNASLSLNYRNKKVNVWGSYAFFQNKSLLEGLVEKTDIKSNPTLSRQEVDGYYLGNSHDIKYGVDYDISSRTSLSYAGATRIIWRESDMNITSNTYTDTSESRTTSGYKSNALSSSHMTFITNGVHLRHLFDNNNRIDIDVNHEIDNTGNNTFFTQDFTTKMSPFMPDTVKDTSGYNSDYSYLTARVDYTRSGENYKWEIGANASMRDMDNPYHQKSITVMPRPIPQVSSSSSYHFCYDEDIYALYTTYSHTFGKFTARGGLRIESSKTSIENLAQDGKGNDELYERDTIDFYPSLHLTYRFNDKNSVMFSYARRVARPSTDQTNPNAVSTNPSRPTVGNPYLLPEYSNSLELTYLGTFRRVNFTASAYWTQNDDVIQNYLTPIHPVTGQTSNGVIYNTFMNYGRAYSIGSEIIAQARPVNWLNVSASGNVYYVDYAIGDNDTWNKSGVNFTAKASATAQLTSQLSVMIMGRYNGPQTYIQGREDAYGVMDAGVRYELFDKKLSLSARVTDLFKSYRSRMTSVIDAGGGVLQNEIDIEKYDTRVFYISASYKF